MRKSIVGNSEAFKKDIVSCLTDQYFLDSGIGSSNPNGVDGQALSYLVKLLRQYHEWKLPYIFVLREVLEEQGFVIEYGKNNRGNRAEVVYLPHPADISAEEMRKDIAE